MQKRWFNAVRKIGKGDLKIDVIWPWVVTLPDNLSLCPQGTLWVNEVKGLLTNRQDVSLRST